MHMLLHAYILHLEHTNLSPTREKQANSMERCSSLCAEKVIELIHSFTGEIYNCNLPGETPAAMRNNVHAESLRTQWVGIK
jgi:hypothetical protein